MINKEFNRMKFLLKGQPRKPLNMDIMESDLRHFEEYAGSNVASMDSSNTYDISNAPDFKLVNEVTTRQNSKDKVAITSDETVKKKGITKSN